MTTAVRQETTLRERIAAAAAAEREAERQSEAAEGLRRAQEMTIALVQLAERHLGLSLTGSEITIDGPETSCVKVYAEIEGIRLTVEKEHFADSEYILCAEQRCTGCHLPTRRAVASLADVHWATTVPHRCVTCEGADDDIIDATEAKIADIEHAASYVADCTNAEAQLEDDRARVKGEAIQRLMQSGAASSVTAAEKIVETDEGYAAHRAMQRDAVRERIIAWARYEAVKLRALRAVQQERAS